MARILRYYGKKRGDRRTGSTVLGIAGEAVFFGALLLLGCVGLLVLWILPAPRQWQVNHDFIETGCTVIGHQVAPQPDGDGTLSRPEVQIEYEVDVVVYSRFTYDIDTADEVPSSYGPDKEQQQEALSVFEVGRAYSCWYDPADPGTVVLVRGSSWWVWLIYSVPLSFVLIGGGGFLYRVLHWGKSTERRAAMAQRARQLDPFQSNGGARRDYPHVPNGVDLTDSPGTRLKFRLPIRMSPGWTLFGLLIMSLTWNAFVAIFVYYAARTHAIGDPDWFLTLFSIPFALGGMGLIYCFVRQLLVTTGIGPTLVEISDHPLYPGDTCQMFVSQAGRLTIKRLEVFLICEEAATYCQGTNTRTEIRRIYQQEVFRREGFEVGHAAPFETECSLDVPPGAMHSFKASHNEVNWKVLVRGNVDGWPEYERVFPLVVHPRSGKTVA